MSSADKYKIPDKNTDAAFREVEKIAQKGTEGNFEIVKKPLTPNDVTRMIPGKRYVDVDTATGKAYLIYRVGNKIYKQSLDEFGANTPTDNRPITLTAILVGNFAPEELIKNQIYDKLSVAASEAPDNSYIIVKAGTYYDDDIDIFKSLHITFEIGSLLIGNSAQAFNIGDGYNNPNDFNVRIDGYGSFQNYSFVALGPGSTGNPNTNSTFYLDCIDIDSGVNSCFYWSNMKEFICKFRNAQGGGNLWDSDNYGGNAVFDFTSVKTVGGVLFNTNNTTVFNLTLKNGYIEDLLGGQGEISVFSDTGSTIKFDNIRYRGLYPLKISDVADGSDPLNSKITIELINSLIQIDDTTFGDVFFYLTDSTFDIPLVSVNSYTNRPEGENHISNNGSMSANDTTDIITHNLITMFSLSRVQFTTSGTLPGGLSVLTDYFIIKLTNTTARVSLTYADAVAGTYIDITDTGTGSHGIDSMGGLFEGNSGSVEVIPNLLVTQFGADFPADNRPVEADVITYAPPGAEIWRITNKDISFDNGGSGTTTYERYIFNNVYFNFNITLLNFINCLFLNCWIKNTGSITFDADCKGGYVMSTAGSFAPSTIIGSGGLSTTDF